MTAANSLDLWEGARIVGLVMLVAAIASGYWVPLLVCCTCLFLGLVVAAFRLERQLSQSPGIRFEARASASPLVTGGESEELGLVRKKLEAMTRERDERRADLETQRVVVKRLATTIAEMRSQISAADAQAQRYNKSASAAEGQVDRLRKENRKLQQKLAESSERVCHLQARLNFRARQDAAPEVSPF